MEDKQKMIFEHDLLDLSTRPHAEDQEIFREMETTDALVEAMEAMWRAHPRKTETSRANILLDTPEEGKTPTSPNQKARAKKDK